MNISCYPNDMKEVDHGSLSLFVTHETDPTQRRGLRQNALMSGPHVLSLNGQLETCPSDVFSRLHISAKQNNNISHFHTSYLKLQRCNVSCILALYTYLNIFFTFQSNQRSHFQKVSRNNRAHGKLEAHRFRRVPVQ